MKLATSISAVVTALCAVGTLHGAGAVKKREPNPALVPIVDEAGLPRVLLIGDSISIGYTLPVREALKGKANVHRIPVNGGPTIRGIESVAEWVAKGPWAVIHFNFGLHDLRRDDAGAVQVPIGDYERNLREIVKVLKATGARLIWASTTPVPEGKLSPVRLPSDVVAYNAVARKVMGENGVTINDLYEFALPRLAEIQRPQNVHFSDDGSRVLAGPVAAAISAALRRE